MNSQKLFTAFLLMLSGLSWGVVAIPVPVSQPAILSVLSAGGVFAVVIMLIRRSR